MIPKGLCQCGCGGKAPLAKQTLAAKGYVKNQPVRFLPGHNTRVGKDMPTLRVAYRREWEVAGIEYGLCLCGCERPTVIAPQTHSQLGHVKDEPKRYIQGHSGHKYKPGETAKGDRWHIEDRGFHSPCWIWQLHRNDSGYGTIMAEGRSQPAHRFYYQEQHGPLDRSLTLDHLCRVRACVRPDHLEPVTHAENCRRGANAKLNADKVRQIRALDQRGVHRDEIARRFGVTSTNIWYVTTRQTWTDVV